MSAPVNYGADTAAFLGDGRDVDDEHDRWLVPGLIPVGLPTMIVGAPKSRKSLLAYHVALGVAAGVPVLGQPTQRGRVLVISREDGAHETRRRLWQLARGLGIDLGQLVADGWLRVDVRNALYLDRPADVARLDAAMREFRPALLVLDSLSRVNTADENDRGSMAAVTNAWSDLCSAHECAVVVLHHEVKDGRAPLLKRVRGTGDLVAVLRVAIGVTKLDERRSRIEVDGNLASMSAPVTFAIDDGVDADGNKTIVVTTEGDPVAAPKRAASSKVSKVPRGESLARLMERIVVELTESKEPRSGRWLRDKLGGQPELHNAACARLRTDPASGVVLVDYPVRGGHHPLWIRELADAAGYRIVGEVAS